MVTIILVSNSNKAVIYKFLDGNDNYKGQITVNKADLSYKLKDKKNLLIHMKSKRIDQLSDVLN